MRKGGPSWATFHSRRLRPEPYPEEVPEAQEEKERQRQETGR
jgi:hypothetical protein